MIKRIFDIFVSSIVLFFLIPLMLVIAILVVINIGRPVFFSQLRPGLHGNHFNIYKFRTMTNCIARHGKQLPDSKRLSRFGKILRSSSMDELPSLLNVIKGDMSLVGPRPLLVEYLPLYNKKQARRHEVRPGITGWAQVNGRNAISWRRKLNLDVWYVENQSFLLDLRILILTIKKVLSRSDISANNQVTVNKFTGNNKS